MEVSPCEFSSAFSGVNRRHQLARSSPARIRRSSKQPSMPSSLGLGLDGEARSRHPPKGIPTTGRTGDDRSRSPDDNSQPGRSRESARRQAVDACELALAGRRACRRGPTTPWCTSSSPPWPPRWPAGLIVPVVILYLLLELGWWTRPASRGSSPSPSGTTWTPSRPPTWCARPWRPSRSGPASATCAS